MGTRAKAKAPSTNALEDDQAPQWAITFLADSVASLKDHSKDKITETTDKLDQTISAHIRYIQNENVQLKITVT